MNNTLPSSSFLSHEYTFDGVPTTIVGAGGPYLAYTKVNVGTAFTDPYGVVYQSPTPVMYVKPTLKPRNPYPLPGMELFKIPTSKLTPLPG